MFGSHLPTTSDDRLLRPDTALASPRSSLLPEFHLLELIRPDTPTPRLDIFTIARRYSLSLSDAVWISSRSHNFLLCIPDAVGIGARYHPSLSDALLTSSGSPNSILRIPDPIVIPPSPLAMPSRHLVSISFPFRAPSRRAPDCSEYAYDTSSPSHCYII